MMGLFGSDDTVNCINLPPNASRPTFHISPSFLSTPLHFHLSLMHVDT